VPSLAASPNQDKTFLITGAGRGIGKRLALGLSASGARIGLLARTRSELQLAHLEIAHGGGSSQILETDVRDYSQCTAAVAALSGIGNAPDALITAHAVFGAIAPLAATDPADWAQATSTNLLGALHVCRAVLPGMIARRRGKILLLTGPGADSPRPNFSAYAATQAALVRLAETLAAEVASFNIQVNCLHPGLTYTSLTDEILAASELAGERELRDAAHTRSTGGAATARQLELVQFLLSDRSNHLSGRLLTVHDDWKRLERAESHPELFTLRRTLRP